MDMPLPNNGENLMQTNTFAKVPAADLAKVQCDCKKRSKRYGKCKGPMTWSFEKTVCTKNQDKKSCDNARKLGKARYCTWRPTRKPTPEPTAEPTPAPTPELFPYDDPLPPPCVGKDCKYKMYEDASCWSGRGRIPFIMSHQGGGCAKWCNAYPWCRAWTLGQSKKHNRWRSAGCYMVVDQELWLENGVFPVGGEDKFRYGTWYWTPPWKSSTHLNCNGENGPDWCAGTFKVQKRCTLSGSHGDDCFHSIYDGGSYQQVQDRRSSRSICFVKEPNGSTWNDLVQLNPTLGAKLK